MEPADRGVAELGASVGACTAACPSSHETLRLMTTLILNGTVVTARDTRVAGILIEGERI